MSRYELIGTADDTASIAAALNARRQQLGLTLCEVNDIAGFAGNYVHKLFASGCKKQLGNLSLSVLLASLGVKLVLVADDEALPPITRRAINERTISSHKIDRAPGRPKRSARMGAN